MIEICSRLAEVLSIRMMSQKKLDLAIGCVCQNTAKYIIAIKVYSLKKEINFFCYLYKMAWLFYYLHPDLIKSWSPRMQELHGHLIIHV